MKKKHDSSETSMGETRTTIISTARKLFMELGYRAVSTRKISEACGLTQPALYHHFSNKNDLYVAVLQDELKTAQSAIERIIKRSSSIEERLYEVIHYILVNSPQNLSQMFHDIRHELPEEFQPSIEKWWFNAYLLPIAGIFEEGLKSGILKNSEGTETNPVSMSYILLSMLSHSFPIKNLTEKEIKEKTIKHAKLVVHVLLYGLTGK
ncbi:TetR/AcrR family transcriptional regulator [Actinomycetes bacterium NPDC127524]